MHASSCFPSGNRLFQIAGILGLIALAGSPVFGATLASYQFTGGSASPTSSLSGVTASSVTSNIGTLGLDSGFSASSNNAFVRATNTGATQSDALSNGAYFEFSLGPNPSMKVDFTQLTFNFGNVITSGSYNASFFLRSSLDNFATDIPITSTTGATTFSGGIGNRTATSPSTSVSDVVTFSLAGAAFQNIDSNVTFRLYTFDDSTSNQAIARFDALTLSGEISTVPEPSATALMALVGGAALLIRRSTRSSRIQS